MLAKLEPFAGIAIGCAMIVIGIAYWRFNRRLTEWQWGGAPEWLSRLRSFFGRSLDEEIWVGYLQAGGLVVVGVALVVAASFAIKR